MELFFLLVVLLILLGIIAAALRMVRWIAKPLETAARSRRFPLQFTVLDVLILFTMLQCTVGTVHYLATGDVEPGSAAARDAAASAFALDAVAAVFFLLCWCCGVSMASRAGINRWWHRVIILGLVAPGTTIGVPFAVVLTPSLFVGGGATVLGILCLAFVVIALCGALTRWIAAKYPLHEPADRLDAGNAAPDHSKSTEG